MWCGCEVSGVILLHDLKRLIRLDRSKDMPAHVSTCKCINLSCVEVVTLIRCVCFCVSSQKLVID